MSPFSPYQCRFGRAHASGRARAQTGRGSHHLHALGSLGPGGADGAILMLIVKGYPFCVFSCAQRLKWI